MLRILSAGDGRTARGQLSLLYYCVTSPPSTQPPERSGDDVVVAPRPRTQHGAPQQAATTVPYLPSSAVIIAPRHRLKDQGLPPAPALSGAEARRRHRSSLGEGGEKFEVGLFVRVTIWGLER